MWVILRAIFNLPNLYAVGIFTALHWLMLKYIDPYNRKSRVWKSFLIGCFLTLSLLVSGLFFPVVVYGIMSLCDRHYELEKDQFVVLNTVIILSSIAIFIYLTYIQFQMWRPPNVVGAFIQ